ncbi:helix-turn-helix domain-containing protein, partial [Levilactobacillus zymae]
SGRMGIRPFRGRVRSDKNGGVICGSVTLRAAIEAGMDDDQAYSLNDEYIRTLEHLGSFDEVMQQIEEILVDMATRVQHLHNV